MTLLPGGWLSQAELRKQAGPMRLFLENFHSWLTDNGLVWPLDLRTFAGGQDGLLQCTRGQDLVGIIIWGPSFC